MNIPLNEETKAKIDTIPAVDWDRLFNQPLEGLLWELDLMPEQITTIYTYLHMKVISEMHKRLYK